MALTVWRSERLVYRHPEPVDDKFLARMSQDPVSFTQSAPFVPRPNGEDEGKSSREWFAKQLLAVIIYLPATDKPAEQQAEKSETDEKEKEKEKGEGDQKDEPRGTPIGFVTLMSNEDIRWRHHRNAEIGITLAAPFHGKGYGSEAIEWVLRWGFRFAGLHRIAIATFSYNSGALRLYRRLGFVDEGAARQALWFDGGWHDLHHLGMLEDEWREREEAKGTSKGMADLVQRTTA